MNLLIKSRIFSRLPIMFSVMLMVVSVKVISMDTPESVGMSSTKLSLVDKKMEQLIDNGNIPGAVIIIARNGSVIHNKSYGFRDLETKSRMKKDSLFWIASMTKAITTAAALILVEEDKIKLDVPITNYLPEFKQIYKGDGTNPEFVKREIMVRDLMRHTSGLSPSSRAKFLPEDELSDRIRRIIEEFTLSRLPGTLWNYSVSTDLLGYIVERVSGKPLYDFLKQKILDPLGMVDTHCLLPSEKRNRLATLYRSEEDGGFQSDDSLLNYNPVLCSGGGGLISTAPDYMRFLLMISAGGSLDGVTILKEESTRSMYHNQLPDGHGWIQLDSEPGPRHGLKFGLGFSVREQLSDWDPDSRVGEYGWGGAFGTHYWISPKDGIVAITFEQVLPHSFLTERAVKGLIYDAINDSDGNGIYK